MNTGGGGWKGPSSNVYEKKTEGGGLRMAIVSGVRVSTEGVASVKSATSENAPSPMKEIRGKAISPGGVSLKGLIVSWNQGEGTGREAGR